VVSTPSASGGLEGADVARSTWPPAGAPLMSSLVQLITGRTHQVGPHMGFAA